MATFRQMREGIAANLQAITSLQVSAYMLGNPTPPYAEVIPGWPEGRGDRGEIDYDRAFQRGLDSVAFTVRVMVGSASDIGAQKRLDGHLDPAGATSVKQATESDTTLGGVVEDLRVVRCGGYRLFPRDGGAPLLGAEWMVEVWTKGT